MRYWWCGVQRISDYGVGNEQGGLCPQEVKPEDLAPGVYWYMVPGKPAEICEKREGEAFARDAFAPRLHRDAVAAMGSTDSNGREIIEKHVHERTLQADEIGVQSGDFVN